MLKREKKEPRFVVQEKEGSEISSLGQAQVIVDKQTGVNYLWVKTGYAGGLNLSEKAVGLLRQRGLQPAARALQI
jgi:hypothetical protein